MLRLEPHPSNPPSDLRIEASVARNAVTYVLEGDIGRLRIPPPAAPRVAEGLWRHTCCEIFLGSESAPRYREFNFSPSGEWTVYEFERYREGKLVRNPALDPRIVVTRGAARLELRATINIEGPQRVGLAAVIEDADGGLSYWALRHPPGKPDFHHADGFALEIDAIRD